MLIRPVQPHDANAWREMRDALWPDERGTHAFDIARFFDGGSPGLEAVFVAESEGNLVGFVELSTRPWAEGCDTSPVGYVEGWYVASGTRRQGVGQALMRAAEAWARAQGFAELASDAAADNEPSRAAHLATGFSDQGLVRCFKKRL